MQNLKTVDFGVAFTLTRPAPADYEDKDGNTQTAAANEPRFNYSNGVAQGLLLDASLSETAAIDDVPAFNASAGHWIIDAEFYNSEPLKGMGLNERFSGSGKMVVSYSGGTAKVWSGGQAIYTVASYTPAEPTHICEGGMASIGSLVYKPTAISDADAAALATGDFELTPFAPDELFANGEKGAWYDPKPEYLYQDAAGTTAVTAGGDPVGNNDDRSPNDNDATQSVSVARPLYQTDGSLHWLAFDGVDDRLGPVTYASPVAQPCTLAIAMNRKDTSSGVIIATGLSSSNRHQISLNVNNRLGAYSGDGGIDSGSFLPVGKHIITVKFDGANSELRLDGAVIATGDMGTSSSGGLTLSSLWSGSNSIAQDVFGLVHVEGVDNIDDIEGYLANLAGIAL